MKPITSVGLNESAPIEFLWQFTTTSPDGKHRYVNCSEVRDTNYGFLQLVPVKESKLHGMTLLVPVSYVAWMLKAEETSPFGFLQEAATTAAQSDPAG